MRFERLDLAPYGHFADRRLTFAPDKALHVVFGRNEAGKTTLLEAIGDFLFKVHDRTSYAFAHGYDALRIGAAVRFADGARLEARRRKGAKNTLLDLADKPIAEDRLQAALAGLDRDTFAAEFGLSQDKLRKGGEALLRAGGKLAETLAAGSASLSALNAVQKRFGEEAGDVFTPERRSAAKPLYKAIDRHLDATRALKAATVEGEEWKAAQAALEEARLGGLDLAAHRRAQETRLARLRRAARVRGKLADLGETAQRLDTLGPAPEVAASALAEARAALAAEAEARAELERLAGEDAETAQGLAALALDAPLLARKPEVTALVRQIGAAENFETDLPRRLADEEEARLALDGLAQRLGLADADALIARHPTEAEFARARALAERARRLRERRVNAETALREAEATLAKLAARGGAGAVNPARLKRRLESFSAALDEFKALARARADFAREGQALAERGLALDPAIADLDALARAALPEEAALARRAEAERGAAEALRAAESALAAAREGAAQRGQALEALQASGSEVTRADWDVARARREAAFDRLAEALATPAAAGDRFETARALALAADAVAERLLFDAERAANLQAARGEFARAQAEAGRREAARDEAEAGVRREQDATGALWAASGVAPGAAARMAGWRRSVAELLERRGKQEARRFEIEALQTRVAAARETLGAWLAEAGVACAASAGFEEAHRVARDRLAELEAAWDEARQIAAAETQARETAERQRRAHAEAEAELAEVARDWPAAMARLGLAGDCLPEEAEAALAAWAGVGVPREKLRSALDRIEKIRLGLDAFTQEAAAVAAAAAPDLRDAAPLPAAAALGERLAAAERAAAERDRLEAERARREARRARIGTAQEARAKALAEIGAALGAADEAALGLALEREAERAALAKTLADLRRDLGAIGDGLTEEELRAEQADFDPALASVEIEDCEARLQGLADDQKRATEAEYAARTRQKALAEGRDAAGAAHERAEAAGEIAELAEHWLLRAAAAALARRAIERHRAAAQDPLIARAGEMFALATAGRFAGLGVGYDKTDQPVLLAQRSGGASVDVAALSEGARDQLFLSLRLALLERRAGEPLPFVGDDLLASFDDERTARTLDLLADFGRSRQTILFTHHARVAELAGALGGAVEVIEI